jgi:hypothetical protein
MSNELHNALSPTSDESRESQEGGESEPYVGLFYVVNGKFYWEGIPASLAGGTPYFKSYPKTHDTYWKDTLVRRFSELKAYDPYHFPRGRVVFDVKKDTYDVLADRCILDDPEQIKIIVSQMKLQEARLTFSWDINCECPVCKSTRIHKPDLTDTDSIEKHFMTTKDGRKLFLAKGLGGIAYVIPSGSEFRSLRSQLKRQAVIASVIIVPLMLLVAEVVAERASGLTLVFMLPLLLLLSMIVLEVWTRFLVRKMEKTDEIEPDLGGIEPVATGEESETHRSRKPLP